ncbi:hypothetical protein [Phenylobacterium zucineum]|uniref:hypothetical protein n=1 Tax=Phenylobacterium zucineum TaxID=284016 RepID=UPI0011D16FF3|nr:hypothetical protein [Phenylobacterium zucineum]
MDWIPAISSSAALAIIGFVLSIPYRRSVEAAISAHFDEKLEESKAEFRRKEETLKAELGQRTAELEALRSGALTSLATRHVEMGKRRILAVERIWAQVTEMGNLKLLCKYAESLHMDKLLEIAEKGGSEGRNVSEFADTILKVCNAEELKVPKYLAASERPFIPDLTWALCSAYMQLLSLPLVQLSAVKRGVGGKMLADPKEMANVLKQALPHKAEVIDQQGPSLFPYLAEELERALLHSLRDALEQKDSDEGAVAQAGRIMDAVRQVAIEQQITPAKVEIPADLHR